MGITSCRTLTNIFHRISQNLQINSISIYQIINSDIMRRNSKTTPTANKQYISYPQSINRYLNQPIRMVLFLS